MTLLNWTHPSWPILKLCSSKSWVVVVVANLHQNSVLPVLVAQTVLDNPAVVAPPPAGFDAATAMTMPVGAVQHSGEHREKRLGIGALPHGNASTSASPRCCF